MIEYRAIARALLLAALVFGAGGCTQKSAEQLIGDAKSLQAKGDLHAAAIQLRNALQANPDNAEARYLLGSVYNRLGDGDSAEKELRRAQKLGLVEGGRVTAELAQAMVRMGKYDRVLAEINVAPAFVPEAAAGVLAARGGAHLAKGQLVEARTAFDEAVKQSPGNPDAMLGMARLKLVERDPAGALALVDEVLAKHPKDFDGWMFKGDLLRARDDIAGAETAYGKALEIRPDHMGARITQATVQVSLRKLDDAQKTVDGIKRMSKQHPLGHYGQGLIYFNQGKYREAQDSVQQALRTAPDYPPLLLLAGAVNYALGNFAQAEQQLNSFLARLPGNAHARKLLAASLVEMNQGKRALEVIQPLMRKDMQDWVVLALAGSAEMSQRNYSGAAVFLEQAVANQPDNPSLHGQLAMSRLGSGDVDRAVAELELATSLEKQASRSDFLLVMTLLRNKQYDKALTAVAQLEKKEPKNPIVHNLRGAAYLGKKDSAAARRSFEQALAIDPVFVPAAVNLAQLDMRDGKPADAKKRFELILAKDKNNLGAALALAKFYAAERKPKEAAALLQQAAEGNPKAIEPRVQLAAFYLRRGEAQRALAFALEAEKIAPNAPEVLDVLGLAQIDTGDRASAAATFGRLISVAPKWPQAYLRLGTAQAMQGNLKGAEASLRKALEQKPDDVEAQGSLAMILARTGRYEQGLRIIREIQVQNPKMALAWGLEGDILYAEKKYLPALKAYDHAYGLEKQGLFVVKAYMAQSLAGQKDAAFARLRDWVEKNPDDTVARRYLADGYLATKQLKEAATQYEALVQRAPADAEAVNNLAVAYQRLKDPRALETAEKAYRLAPDSELTGGTLGWVMIEHGQAAKAIEVLERTLAKSPDSPVIQYYLALGRAKTGDKARAKRELERLVASGKKFPQLEEARALLAQL